MILRMTFSLGTVTAPMARQYRRKGGRTQKTFHYSTTHQSDESPSSHVIPHTEGVSHHGFVFDSGIRCHGRSAPSAPSMPATSMGEDIWADIRPDFSRRGVASSATTLYG